MIVDKLEVGFRNGKGTPEENVLFFEFMTKEEMFEQYDKTMKALSTESMFITRDARGYANIIMDCWNRVHNERGWYDIYEDGGKDNPYPIRYISRESVESVRAMYI